MADLNLKFENGKAPALNADNMNRIVNEINFINERTKNAVAVAANPKVKPKYALNTIMIGDDVYLVDGNAGSTKYDLLGKQVGEDVRFFQPSENAKQIILMAIYRRCFQGSAIIDLEEKTIKATSTSVENELYNKYLGQLWDENHASQNTFTYNYNADNDDYTFYWNGIDGFGTETLVYYAFDGNVSVRSSYYELEVAVISVEKSQEIGISTWEELENKPFESLNADNFEVDEVGTLSIKDDGRIAMLENEVSDLDKNKVNQLNMSTGIDISDWDRDIDPDVPVIVDKYVNYHDAVSKLSQQIDVMGNRTDDLKTSLNTLINYVDVTLDGTAITQKDGSHYYANVDLTSYLPSNSTAISVIKSGSDYADLSYFLRFASNKQYVLLISSREFNPLPNYGIKARVFYFKQS